jgi:hypothetical protein
MPNYATTATYDAVTGPSPALDNPAVKRCCKAWKKVYGNEYLEQHSEMRASLRAGDAYCAVMPPLTTRENCRDFIACVAYGIIIKAIAEKDGGKLLYAAQVALSSFANEKEPQKPASSGPIQPEIATDSKEKA